jgi:3-dehydroquinate synthase
MKTFSFDGLPNVSRIVVVTDDNVNELYGKSLLKQLGKTYPQVDLFSIRPGEESKSRINKAKIEDWMLELGCMKDTMMIAFGGGVVGDLAGFVASTFMRGIPFVQIPTTLLAMVDSSIGGKTAINTKHGKNLLGSFWNPERILIDITFLQTLSDEQISNGFIEIIKIFLSSDKNSFSLLEKDMSLDEAIEKAIKLKMSIVAKDADDNNVRNILNFGHSIGHALEHLSDKKLIHGFAVGLGILVEAKMSEIEGQLSHEEFIRIETMLKKHNVRSETLRGYSLDQIVKIMRFDKKNSDNQINYVCLESIGKVQKQNHKYVKEIKMKTLEEAFHNLTT